MNPTKKPKITRPKSPAGKGDRNRSASRRYWESSYWQRSDAPLPPEYALTVRQPWAWLICHGGKNIENRLWRTRRRGRFLVHAALGMTRAEYEAAAGMARRMGVVIPEFGDLERGGIVGEVEIVGCVEKSDSPWFFGRWGFQLKNARPLPFLPCKGALGFWKIDRKTDSK